MPGKKSPKKGGKAKSPKKAAAAPKLDPEEEAKKAEEYANLVNIPTHGWMKIEVGLTFP